jgi:hypothetical protein
MLAIFVAAVMIEATERDIGRKVTYRDRGGYKVEEGIITSMNDQYIFVRYGAETISKATRPQDLEYSNA